MDVGSERAAGKESGIMPMLDFSASRPVAASTAKQTTRPPGLGGDVEEAAVRRRCHVAPILAARQLDEGRVVRLQGAGLRIEPELEDHLVVGAADVEVAVAGIDDDAMELVADMEHLSGARRDAAVGVDRIDGERRARVGGTEEEAACPVGRHEGRACRDARDAERQSAGRSPH